MCEPILMILEPGFLEIPGEGHEPDSGDQAMGADVIRGGLHPRGIRARGLDLREVFLRTIGLEAVLPAVVNLDERESERL